MRGNGLFRLTVAVAAAAAVLPVHAGAATPHILQADLTGDINNITDAYISNEVSRAESEHADALLVVLNTPGGISTSMDDIVTSLLNSSVPTIVYVYPSGARAASAGLFISQAADVLAMAPGTNIGSMRPARTSAATSARRSSTMPSRGCAPSPRCTEGTPIGQRTPSGTA